MKIAQTVVGLIGFCVGLACSLVIGVGIRDSRAIPLITVPLLWAWAAAWTLFVWGICL